MSRALLITIGFMLVGATALAAPSVQVSVDQTTVTVNNPFSLQVEVTGGIAESPVFPEIAGLQIGSTPEQSGQSISIANGAMSQKQTLIYRAVATRAGKITIPSITVRVGGTDVATKAIELTAIRGTRTPLQGNQGQNNYSNQQSSPHGSPTTDDAVLITAEVDKKTVYVGEAVQLTLSQWSLSGVQASPFRRSDPGYPKTEGFYATGYEPHRTQRTRNGWPYRVIQLTQKLYPTRAGKLTITSWHWSGEALMQSRTGRFLHEDYNLSTDPITITVKPLPAQPPNFSGAVGSFNIQAEFPGSSTPKEAQQGVPIKMVIEVEGDGNPDSIGEPKVPPIKGATLTASNADAEGNVDSTTGLVTKNFAYTISPLEAGSLTIQPIEFCYFDPVAEKYDTKTVGPFEFDVRPSLESGGGVVVTNAEPVEHGKVSVIGRDIDPNAAAPASLGPYRPSAARTTAVATAPVLAYAGLALFMARRRRFETDKGYARSYFAKSKAQKHLRAVADAAEPADELYRAVIEFVADKFNIEGAGLTTADLRQLLESHKVETELSESLLKIARACERARYASVKLTADEVNALTRAAQVSLDALDHEIAKRPQA